ncbi:MAG: flagellar biosynthetic protein FliR [Alphaproteobacteria bacterium]|nr:flagellar biosynthetic protein FliR [Alphaproteobacteria bacterium]
MSQLVSFSGLELQSIFVYLLSLFLASLRMGAFLVASPFFGSRMVPLPVRIVFSIALGLGAMNYVSFPSLEVLTSVAIVPIIFQELLLGLTCGMILNICFSAVILAGEKIATTSGLAFASQVDPTNGAQSPVISQIFSLFLLVLFFSLNGHLVIFELLYKSYETLPLGSLNDLNSMFALGIEASSTIYEQAVIIVLPIVSLLFLMNLGIGFITKSAPQLNLFSFGFPLTILGTFFALYFSVDALQFVFSDLIDRSLNFVRLVLAGGNDG